MIVADLPPQITLECAGTRSGFFAGPAGFELKIYIDVASRRFVTTSKGRFGWPRQGTLNAVLPQKIVLWNISEEIHPFLQSWAEFNLDSRHYVGGISYTGRALIDEKHLGNCVIKPSVPAPFRKLLLNAQNR